MKYKLKDIGTITTGKTPSKKIVGAYGKKINFLTPRDLNGQRYSEYTERRLSLKGIECLKNYEVIPPSISVSCIGSDMGKVVFNKTPIVTNQQLNSISNIRKDIDPLYLYYLLYNKRILLKFMGSDRGSTMPILSKREFGNLEFEFPNLKTQKSISSRLDSLDKKIEVNSRINDNLLELLDTEFHHQFSHQTHFRREKIRDYVKITRGSSPRPIKNFLTTFGRPWIKISDISNLSSPYLYKTKQYISKLGISKSKTVIPGTLILSNSATPGIPVISKIVASVHDGWLIISDYKLMNRNWFYLFFRQIRQELLKRANGSVFDNLKISIVENFPINVPNKDLLKRFEKISDPIFSEMEKLQLENIRLTKIKEALLNLYF